MMTKRGTAALLIGAFLAALVAFGCTGDDTETRAVRPAPSALAPTAEATPQALPPAAALAAAEPAPPTPNSAARAATVLSPSAPSTAVPARQALAGEPVFGKIVRDARPAVVSIAVRVQAIDPFFRLVNAVQTGSGVIIDPRGYILTNEHVIANALRIEVTTDDEETYVAEVVGRDAATDLAVIKIAGSVPFPTLSFGGQESYAVGDWVIAIGNALGLAGGPTVTVGVIGALERTITVDSDVLSDLVQTDAAINQGNSGGPLINLNGQIVGINTIVAQEGASQGIGFAVSSFTAARVAQALMEHGRVPWAWLGIGVEELSPSRALELGLQVRKGVIIQRLSRGGPAHVAGLQPGDVLLKLDENALRRVRDLDVLLRDRYQAGDSATVTYLRGSAEATAKVTFSEAPRR